MTSSKILINDFSDKTFTQCNYPILKYLCKFQVGIPINAIVIAVQSLEDLYIFILGQPCWWAKECLHPNFPYEIIENPPTSLAYNSVFVDPNNFKFGTETHCMVIYGHIKILGTLIITCMVMFLMMSYANHQYSEFTWINKP